MEQDYQTTVNETHRLKAEAEQRRTEAVQIQINAGLTFCRVAKTDVEKGNLDNARKLVHQAQRTAETVRRHLREPDHVPPDQVENLRAKLAQLDSAILAIESSADAG